MNPMSLKLLFNGFRYGKLCVIWLCIFSVASACGDDDFDPKSVLASYRVVALRAEPAELSLTSTSVLSLYDFHPGDLVGGRPEIEYEWRLCPFSLGSVAQYECLLDELILKSNSSMEDMSETQGEEVDFEGEEIDDRMGERPAANATLTLNPLELFSTLGDDLQMQMEQLEMGVGMLGSEMNFFESGAVEVYVKLTSKIEDEESFELVKSMTVIFDTERVPNQNPVIDEVKIEPTFTETQTVDLEAEVTLEVTAVEGSVESYQSFLSADAVENGIKAEVREESLLVSYYTTSGRFKQAVKLIEDTETTLTIGEEDGDQLLFIVLRDGRGGVDLRRYEFSVE